MVVLPLVLLACARPPVPEGPDLVLFTVDTLRHDRLGYRGHAAARTPQLDALAAAGRVFTQATTPLPRTTPGLASLLTGLQPHRHGAREVGEPIGAVRTVAAAFRARGWQTVGVSGTAVAGPAQGLDAGFDDFRVHEAPAAALVAEGLAALGDGPALLWVHVTEPHFPYLPPGATGPCAELGRETEAHPGRRPDVFGDRDGRASAVLADCQRLYDGEVAAVDAAFGALQAGLAGRTRPRWTVFTADHGENMGEGGLFYEHGPDAHDASLRVPLVVTGPGVVPGRDAGPATLQDVGATLLALAGDPLDGLDGRDLAPRLGGGPAPDTPVVAESGSALFQRSTATVVSGRASRRPCWHQRPWSLCRAQDGTEALYDHVADPGFRHDRAAAEPAALAAMQAVAARWPPERARQQVVRGPRFKLLSTPTPTGRVTTLVDHTVDPQHTVDRSADHPEVVAALTARLDAWRATLEGEPVAAEGPVESALRSLGYIE